ncbi:oxygenase MpaB family protein [Kineococcus gynurae]|uniref:Oxygenase MpaB family protein n=1 Tax=Kineococcus gynurae TaxID=452979 RepID=A0ABV5LN64_9ACTN
MSAESSTPVRASPTPQEEPATVEAALHGPLLPVALLAAALVEEAHPVLAVAAATDPRHPWQRIRDLASVVRAARRDPCRALALAARERVLMTSSGDLEPERTVAVRHALRLSAVFAASASAGRRLDPAQQERYVRDQVGTAVLLGAQDEVVPDSVERMNALVEEIRLDVESLLLLSRRPAGPTSPTPRGSRCIAVDEPRMPGWVAASTLAPSLLPAWADRPGLPDRFDDDELRRRLTRLEAAALRPRRR